MLTTFIQNFAAAFIPLKMAEYTEEADYGEEDYQEGEEYYEDGNFAEGGGEEGEGELNPDEMKKKVEEMEEELEKITKMQQQVTDQLVTTADKLDETSIYVGQVDYEATAEELQAHFAPCGVINRVTIICDKITGHSKGFAYVEFAESSAVEKALKLDNSEFRGRQLKVLPKRQNLPPVALRGGGRGRGGRGGGPVYGGRGSMRAFAGRGAGRFRGGGGRVPRGGGRFGGRFPRGGRGGFGAYYNPYY
eukprot:gene8480-9176_t